MDEYIERSAGVSILRAKANMAVLMGAAPYFEKAAQMLEKLPVADVAPVVHGRWMKHIKGGTLCSRCGSYTQHNGDVLDMSKAIACPWCGAKMDGGADHEAD